MEDYKEFRTERFKEFKRAHPTAVSQEFAILKKELIEGIGSFCVMQGLNMWIEDTLTESLDNYFELDSREEETEEETTINLSPPTLVLFFRDYLTCLTSMHVPDLLDIKPYLFHKDRAEFNKCTQYELRNIVTYSEEAGYTSYVVYGKECFSFEKKGRTRLNPEDRQNLNQLTGVVVVAYSKQV